jgi:ABC-2 type transport system ATP-binding protein
MENIIEVKNLVKKYGNLVAVDDVTFNVKKGEIFDFLGPNGAGKTTTIKMLTTLTSPTSGEIMINGYDTAKQQKEVRDSFGIVFQDPSLDDELTAYENLDMHGMLYKVKRKDRKERIEQLLNFVELWGRKDELVKHFSGGMKRRLEIARGFLHHPKVLFLDEPTIGLDPQTRNHIWTYLKKMNEEEGTTVFLTTHYMEEADKVSNTIAIIDHGKIISGGTAQELKSKTNTNSLEEAFLQLTGKEIREEKPGAIQGMRQNRRMWRH